MKERNLRREKEKSSKFWAVQRRSSCLSLLSGFFHCHCHCHTLLPFTCAPDFFTCIARGSFFLNCADQSFFRMWNSVFSFLCELVFLLSGFLFTCCCAVFLLNAAVFVDLAMYLAVCGSASVESFALLPFSCFRHVWHRFIGCLLLELFTLSFSQARRLEICNI